MYIISDKGRKSQIPVLVIVAGVYSLYILALYQYTCVYIIIYNIILHMYVH